MMLFYKIKPKLHAYSANEKCAAQQFIPTKIVAMPYGTYIFQFWYVSYFIWPEKKRKNPTELLFTAEKKKKNEK